MKNLVMTLFTVVIVMSFTPSAFSFGPASGKRSDIGHYDDFDSTALSQVDLTVEQTIKINSLREAFLKDTRPTQDKLLNKKSDLKLLWLQQNPDKEKIFIEHKEIRELRNQIKDKWEVYRLKVCDMLTPEQKEKLESCGRSRSFRHGMSNKTGRHVDPVQRKIDK